MAIFVVLGFVLLIVGWKMTGQLTGLALMLAGVVLLLLPVLRNHAMLMFTSVCVFAALTLLVEPLRFVRFVAGGVLVIVGSRHVREANAALEAAKAQLAAWREGRKAV